MTSVILCGNMGVGKSNIVQRYVRGVFSKSSPTIGVDFIVKKLYIKDDICIKIQIWDTSGSERYKSITIGHFRDALGALLVFDITNKESFHDLDYWLEQVRQHVDPSCVIALMANKKDLVDQKEATREIQTEQIQEYAEINNLVFLGECSA